MDEQYTCQRPVAIFLDAALGAPPTLSYASP
jgi:hypothetical protein